MVQYTVSSTIHCSSTKCLQAGSLDNQLLNWRKGTYTCQGILWWYATAHGWLLNRPVTGYGRWANTSSLINRWKAKDGAIPAHNNTKILHMGNSVKSDADIMLASPRLTCKHCTSKRISHQCLILWPLWNHLRPAIRLWKCKLLSTCVLLQHDNAWPHTAHVTRHDQGHLSASLILWTCLTSLLVSYLGPQISNLTQYKKQC